MNFGSKSAFIALFSQIGITLFVANLGGALLGRWVDGALNSTPIFLIAGFVGGFAVGFGILLVLWLIGGGGAGCAAAAPS